MNQETKCSICNRENGKHTSNCIHFNWETIKPRRFRKPITQKHQNGTNCPYMYGCYFPLTDLCVQDMAHPGTGKPTGVEWLDEEVS